MFQDDSFEQRFMSSATLCPAVAPATSSGGLAQLDPKYLCSGLLPSTATSHRITGLQNGIPYGVGVAAVDKFYNVSAISNIAYATPIPTVDFYSEYRQDGGLAKGGYCTLVGRHGRPSVVAILCLAGLGLVLRRRRRSKRRRPGAGTLVILVVTGTLTAGQARAQRTSYGSSFEDSFGDSSDDSADAPPPAPADEADDEAAAAPADDASDDSFVDVPADEAWTGSPRNFAIEARFGLYTPNIDSEISGSGRRPQSFMFGSERRPMWQLEFDWEFLQTFGTLALGGVIGYYKESAKACYLSDLELTQKCNRSADDTSLRLIPVAALLIYRMDEVAERWRIPLVPYAKIGLNYTFWTVNNGDGNVPTYPNTGGSRGKGGTMGWQAAVGLSLRLDFLDPSGARTFDTESGVNHTYAFFELDHVDSSGLYRKDALRVGDDTWFTGLMFEF